MEIEYKSTYEIINCDENYSLCTISDQLQQKLAVHFQEFHFEAEINEDNYVQHCQCTESLDIQHQIINHLLSHLIPKEFKIEEEVIEELDCDELEEEVIYETQEEEINNDKIVAHESVEEEVSPVEKLSNNYQCNFCHMSYKTQKAFTNHLRDEHDENNTLICPFAPECKSKFNDDRKLRAHKNKHEAELSKRDDGTFECRNCGKHCLSKDLLIAHIGMHIQQYQCDYCPKTFSRHNYMKSHVLQHVFGPQKLEKKKKLCELCSQWVASDRMKRHLYTYHSDKKDYKCHVCGKEFKQATSLRSHLDHHQMKPRYSCDFCGKTFYNQSNYKNHMLRHTEPDRFKCEICGDRYVNAKSLSQHKVRKHDHQKEKIFCTYEGCDKFYFLDTSLKMHIRRVHNNPKEEVIQNCSMCKFSANTKNLQRHIWRVHKIKQRNHRVFS